MKNFTDKRITVFVGHYGTGKTEVALNYTKLLKKLYDKVMILDMDVINPFYRTKDMQYQLEELGVKVIAPRFANTQIELPSISPMVYSAFDQKDYRVVIDCGGDDQGSLALGSLARRFCGEDYQVFYVINKSRPLTATPEEAVEYMHEIEAACRLKVTGIINNTNLSYETVPQIILDSLSYAKDTASLAGVPLIATSVLSEFAPIIAENTDNVFPIDINIKRIWDK